MNRTIILLLALSFSTHAFGFRPIGHVILQRTIAHRLPSNNIFKKAMDAYPTMAAWGSLGPDLGYSPDLTMRNSFARSMARYNNYADIAHYYKTGTFCRALVDSAVTSGNQELIAFAAGWLTHVAGDFGSHQLFVYPEAGYYIENPAGRVLHGTMEQYAESVVFRKGALLSNGAFYVDENMDAASLKENFFGMSGASSDAGHDRAVIRDFLAKVFKSVYADTYDLNTDYIMKRYGRAFGSLPGKAAGFSNKGYDYSVAKLGPTALNNLESAFDFGVKFGQKLLESCLENNFQDFSDKWNLDIGPDAKTLVIKLTIDEQFASGSKNDLFVNLKLKTALSAQLNYRIKLLNSVRYRRNDILYGYVALNDCNFEPDRIYSFFISKSGSIKDRSRIKSLTIENNGRVVYHSDDPFELNAANSRSNEFKFSESLKN